AVGLGWIEALVRLRERFDRARATSDSYCRFRTLQSRLGQVEQLPGVIIEVGVEVVGVDLVLPDLLVRLHRVVEGFRKALVGWLGTRRPGQEGDDVGGLGFGRLGRALALSRATAAGLRHGSLSFAS